MLHRARCPERGVNPHVNATCSQIDQSRPGLAGRDPLPDLKSPLPDVRLAGGRNAVFHTFVDHEPPRAGPTAQSEVLATANNPVNYGKVACDLHGAHARDATRGGRVFDHFVRASSIGE